MLASFENLWILSIYHKNESSLFEEFVLPFASKQHFVGVLFRNVPIVTSAYVNLCQGLNVCSHYLHYDAVSWKESFWSIKSSSLNILFYFSGYWKSSFPIDVSKVHTYLHELE